MCLKEKTPGCIGSASQHLHSAVTFSGMPYPFLRRPVFPAASRSEGRGLHRGHGWPGPQVERARRRGGAAEEGRRGVQHHRGHATAQDGTSGEIQQHITTQDSTAGEV